MEAKSAIIRLIRNIIEHDPSVGLTCPVRGNLDEEDSLGLKMGKLGTKNGIVSVWMMKKC
jgi:hypothetical protein